MTQTQSTKQARYTATRRVTIVGALVNIQLAIVQVIGGIFANSQALLADGIHTLSDLASDFIVLASAKIASKEADEDHPYGHGRFETLGTVILGLILSGVAISIAVSAVESLFFDNESVIPETIALTFAFLAVVSKEGLYHYTMRTANRIDSDMLRANAWHHRSDAVSSIVVLIGTAGAVFLKIPWLDSAAALIVAVLILMMGIRLVINSVNELLESSVDPKKVQEIRDEIGQLDYIESLHMLRTRKLGGQIFADVHIQVASHISVSEGHFIADCIREKLHKKFLEMEDITIHIDPEDDEVTAPSAGLMSRKEVEELLQPVLADLQLENSVNDLRLHYLDGQIEIEIYLESSAYDMVKLNKLQQEVLEFDQIKSIKLHQPLLA